MDAEKTQKIQNQRVAQLSRIKARTTLGVLTDQSWYDDSKHLLYMMSRYKFVAKMLSGKRKVLEVGCGYAFCTRIVLQEVTEICAIDFDPVRGMDIPDRMEDKWHFEYRVHDIVSGPMEGQFDAAYALDVLEHIPVEDEHRFMTNIAHSLDRFGVLIIGTPSLESQQYASESSGQQHVNCKDHQQLKGSMSGYFDNVFLFSMNDEVVHTGFYPMAHYLFALCVGVKSRP